MADFKTMFLRILWILLVMKSVDSVGTQKNTTKPLTTQTAIPSRPIDRLTVNFPPTTTTTSMPATTPTTTIASTTTKKLTTSVPTKPKITTKQPTTSLPTTKQATTQVPTTLATDTKQPTISLPATPPKPTTSLPTTTPITTTSQTTVILSATNDAALASTNAHLTSSPPDLTTTDTTATTITILPTMQKGHSILTAYPSPTPVSEMTPTLKATERPQTTNGTKSGGNTTEETTNSTEAIDSTTTTTPKPAKSTPKSTVILTPSQPTMPSKGTTEAQNGSKSKSKSYDRELVIIFGVMLGLMFVVIVIFGIHKCRHRNKESDDLPMSSADKYRNGGEDVTIAASSF